MAETEESSQHQRPPPPPASMDSLSQKFEKLSVPSPFSIWPPTQRTRDAVINRLVETLSQPSVLSKRYGSMPPEDASATAHAIEEEAFTAAGGAAGVASIDDGIDILQVYSKEISKRMLDAVKSRGAAANQESSSVKSTAEATSAASETADASERESSIEHESS